MVTKLNTAKIKLWDNEIGAVTWLEEQNYALFEFSKRFEENDRAHFLTKRFDRESRIKSHVQTLCGMAHFDYNAAGEYGYEQAFSVMRQIHLTKSEIVEQFRRMVFNVFARNQDDHTKNIAYIMDLSGKWRLTPAYDVMYSHNPHGRWTNKHQMTINGKRDNFSYDDLLSVAASVGVPKAKEIIAEVCSAVGNWPNYAKEAGVKKNVMNEVAQYHRLDIMSHKI